MVFKVHRISPAIFGFALFCFLLPFVTLSCPGGQFTFSGTQLALGTTVEAPDMFGQKGEEKKIPPEPLALLALLCLGVGVGAGILLSAGPGRWVNVLLGVLAAVFLLLLRGKISSDALKEGQGMFQVSFGVGYWLALLASCLTVAFNAAFSKLFPAFRVEPAAEPSAPSAPVTSGQPGS
ncbi:MAG TPA: hypothetical protein VKM72_19860 [Thermoanaerobaculia bacterium]|nr:hypothetical protein [Thermoanaerobaculia bacterium]